MSVVAALSLSIEHPLESQIVGVLDGTGSFGDGHALFSSSLVCPGEGGSAAQNGRRLLYGTHRPETAAAAAGIALQSLFYLLIGRSGFGIKQGLGGHNLPRRARAALHHPVKDKSLLQRVE